MIHVTGTPADLDRPAVLWHNLLADGTLTASGSAAGTFPANALGPQTYDGWAGDALPAWLAVELAAAAEADCCAIVAHNLGTMGATVIVEVWTGSAWAAVATATPAGDDPLMLIWPVTSAARWRLRVTGAAVPWLGVVILGRRLIIPATIAPPYVPADLARRVDLEPQVSLGGHYVGATAWRQALELEAQFTPLPRSFVHGADMMAFADHYDHGGTFFWAGGAAVMPRDLAYCWRRGDELRPANSPGDYWAAVTLRMAGYGA